MPGPLETLCVIDRMPEKRKHQQTKHTESVLWLITTVLLSPQDERKLRAQKNPVYILAEGLLGSVFFILWPFLSTLISDLQGYNDSSADSVSIGYVARNILTHEYVVLLKYPRYISIKVSWFL